MTKADYNERIKSRILLDELEKAGAEEAYRKIYQSNSNALYFAASENLQETWLPLLEKAFAKAHGDYAALEGGFTGEAIEDLTGGVTTEIFTTDILNKDDYWRDMLKVNRIFLFSCSTGIYGIRSETKEGIIDRHAYSIQNAVEIDGKRLLRLKNPWGMGEWKGAWSKFLHLSRPFKDTECGKLCMLTLRYRRWINRVDGRVVREAGTQIRR